MQERQRSWSAVRAWVQVSFHAPSVALEWAAAASSAMAASTGCTRNAVGSSAWQRTLTTDVHGARELHAPWTTDHWRKSGSDLTSLRWQLSFATKESCSQQQVAVNFQPQLVWKLPGRSSRSCYQFSLHATSLSRHVAMCTALVCGAQCSMSVRLGHWQSQTSQRLQRNDRAMIRQICNVRPQDIVTTRSSELLARLGI